MTLPENPDAVPEIKEIYNVQCPHCKIIGDMDMFESFHVSGHWTYFKCKKCEKNVRKRGGWVQDLPCY